MATSLEAPPQLQTTETAEVRPDMLISVTHVPEETPLQKQQRKEIERTVRSMTVDFALRTQLRLARDGACINTSRRADEQSLLLHIARHAQDNYDLLMSILEEYTGKQEEEILALASVKNGGIWMTNTRRR